MNTSSCVKNKYDSLSNRPVSALLEQAGLASCIDVGAVKGSKKICVISTGESSITADIISAYADRYSEIPVLNYSRGIIPGCIDEDTDVILLSYSDENETMNGMYDKVTKSKCRIYCVTDDAHLSSKCEEDGNNLIAIPSDLSYCSLLGYELGALASIIEKMGICDIKTKMAVDLKRVEQYCESLIKEDKLNSIETKVKNSPIAIYGSSDLRAACKRWKMMFNNDIGLLAFCGELPEFNHNEIVGWANHSQNGDMIQLLMFREHFSNEVLDEIINRAVEVLEESDRHVISIDIPGDDPIEKNLCAIMLGEMFSFRMREGSGNEGGARIA